MPSHIPSTRDIAANKIDKNPFPQEAHSPMEKTNKEKINKEIYVSLWMRSATKK